MKSQPATVRTALGALIGAVALAACGGGGGGGSNPAPAAPPTVTISTSPTAVATGGTSTITWSSTGATSCTASGGWSGARAASGTETVGPISAPTTYTLSCTGTGGSGSASATLGFNPPPTVSLSANPNAISPAQTTTLTWTSTNSTSCTASGAWSGTQATTGTFTTGPLAATSTFTLSCTGAGGTAQASTSVTVGPPVQPVVQLNAQQTTVFIGETVFLNWITQGVSGCVASGGWSGAQANIGSAQIGPFAATTTFTLTCNGPSGPISSSVTVTATLPPPPVVNLVVSPNSITAGSSAQLSWNTGINNSCTASGGWSGPRVPTGNETTGPVSVTTTYTLTCTNAGGSTAVSATLTVTGPNTPPVADAGADRTVRSGDSVFLSGASSSDPGGGVTGYSWSQTSGPPVVLSTPNSVQVFFAAPVVASTTTLTFSLVVTDNLGLTSAPDSVTVTVDPPTGGVVPLRGKLTYERVPFSTTLGSGLDFTATRREPSRGVRMELINAGGFVIASTVTDANGDYSFDAPANTSVTLRASAVMLRAAPNALPRWNVQVRDMGTSSPAYAVVSPAVQVGAAATTFDINIPAGWDAVTRQPNGPRLAAPFAILDTIYRALQTVTAVAPTADFPVLTVDWSPTKPAGQTFYDSDDGGSNRRISLSGQVNADIDEYDAHTIAHEFGHYLEDRFSRSDSIGGPHTFGDRLDPRLAFGEGFGYAFAAIVLNDPQIRDVGGNNQASELFFNIETDATTAEGWYSEGSVQEILWDLFDANNEGSDALTLGFAPIWAVLTGAQRDADALTTIFTFISSLKAQNTASATQIDGIVAAEAIIAPTINAFATTETNSAQSADVLPVYTNIGVGTGTVTVRSINTFGVGNKLSNRRFLRLDLAAPQRLRIRASIAAAPRDPDIVLWRRGVPAAFGVSPTNEDFFADLGAGTYIVETYDCGNADCGPDAPGPFDIAVTISTN